ncbi:MAG: hypothetical protein QOI07_1617 [Verrucomicrobiota bacterium]|jgi:hypothetical protein
MLAFEVAMVKVLGAPKKAFPPVSAALFLPEIRNRHAACVNVLHAKSVGGAIE